MGRQNIAFQKLSFCDGDAVARVGLSVVGPGLVSRRQRDRNVRVLHGQLTVHNGDSVVGFASGAELVGNDLVGDRTFRRIGDRSADLRGDRVLAFQSVYSVFVAGVGFAVIGEFLAGGRQRHRLRLYGQRTRHRGDDVILCHVLFAAHDLIAVRDHVVFLVGVGYVPYASGRPRDELVAFKQLPGLDRDLVVAVGFAVVGPGLIRRAYGDRHGRCFHCQLAVRCGHLVVVLASFREFPGNQLVHHRALARRGDRSGYFRRDAVGADQSGHIVSRLGVLLPVVREVSALRCDGRFLRFDSQGAGLCLDLVVVCNIHAAVHDPVTVQHFVVSILAVLHVCDAAAGLGDQLISVEESSLFNGYDRILVGRAVIGPVVVRCPDRQALRRVLHRQLAVCLRDDIVVRVSGRHGPGFQFVDNNALLRIGDGALDLRRNGVGADQTLYLVSGSAVGVTVVGEFLSVCGDGDGFRFDRQRSGMHCDRVVLCHVFAVVNDLPAFGDRVVSGLCITDFRNASCRAGNERIAFEQLAFGYGNLAVCMDAAVISPFLAGRFDRDRGLGLAHGKHAVLCCNGIVVFISFHELPGVDDIGDRRLSRVFDRSLRDSFDLIAFRQPVHVVSVPALRFAIVCKGLILGFDRHRFRLHGQGAGLGQNAVVRGDVLSFVQDLVSVRDRVVAVFALGNVCDASGRAGYQNIAVQEFAGGHGDLLMFMRQAVIDEALVAGRYGNADAGAVHDQLAVLSRHCVVVRIPADEFPGYQLVGHRALFGEGDGSGNDRTDGVVSGQSFDLICFVFMKVPVVDKCFACRGNADGLLLDGQGSGHRCDDVVIGDVFLTAHDFVSILDRVVSGRCVGDVSDASGRLRDKFISFKQAAFGHPYAGQAVDFPIKGPGAAGRLDRDRHLGVLHGECAVYECNIVVLRITGQEAVSCDLVLHRLLPWPCDRAQYNSLDLIAADDVLHVEFVQAVRLSVVGEFLTCRRDRDRALADRKRARHGCDLVTCCYILVAVQDLVSFLDDIVAFLRVRDILYGPGSNGDQFVSFQQDAVCDRDRRITVRGSVVSPRMICRLDGDLPLGVFHRELSARGLHGVVLRISLDQIPGVNGIFHRTLGRELDAPGGRCRDRVSGNETLDMIKA